MSGTIDPKRLEMTRYNLKRWLRDWWYLTCRCWSAVLCISVVAIGLIALLSHISTSYWMLRICDLVACISMAMLVLEYTGADHPVPRKRMLAALWTGLPEWLAIAGGLYCAIQIFLLGIIAIVMLFLLVSHLLFGAASGPHTLPPLPPEHIQRLPDGLWHLIALFIDGGNGLIFASFPYCLILVVSYVAFFIGGGPAMIVVLSFRFIRRNRRLIYFVTTLQFLDLMVCFFLERLVPWSLLALGLTVGMLPFVSGITYVLARESFMGQGRNQPARARRRVDRSRTATA